MSILSADLGQTSKGSPWDRYIETSEDKFWGNDGILRLFSLQTAKSTSTGFEMSEWLELLQFSHVSSESSSKFRCIYRWILLWPVITRSSLASGGERSNCADDDLNKKGGYNAACFCRQSFIQSFWDSV